MAINMDLMRRKLAALRGDTKGDTTSGCAHQIYWGIGYGYA